MVTFQIKKIKKTDQLGDLLTKTRQERNLTIEQAARSLGLAAKYLKALEANCFSALPGEIYIKNFIKKYAEFLGLKSSSLLDQYRAEKENQPINKKIKMRPSASCRFSYLWSAPHFLRLTLALTIMVIVLSYLGWQIKGIFQPPALQIAGPAEGFVSLDSNLKVLGQTAPETKVQINGKEIISNNQGSFEEKVDLHEGLNVITITAIKKYGQSTTVVRNVIYKH